MNNEEGKGGRQGPPFVIREPQLRSASVLPAVARAACPHRRRRMTLRNILTWFPPVLTTAVSRPKRLETAPRCLVDPPRAPLDSGCLPLQPFATGRHILKPLPGFYPDGLSGVGERGLHGAQETRQPVSPWRRGGHPASIDSPQPLRSARDLGTFGLPPPWRTSAPRSLCP
jgi:hypothetical protein